MDKINQDRQSVLKKKYDFSYAALTVAFVFLLFIAFLICWKSNWSWDAIKQSFSMIAMALLAYIIFAFMIFPSLGFKLIQKFSVHLGVSIQVIIYIALFLFLIWFVLEDVHKHSFKIWETMPLVLIAIFGFLRVASPMMEVNIPNKRLSKLFWQIAVLVPLGLLGTVIIGFFALCYWARYGN